MISACYLVYVIEIVLVAHFRRRFFSARETSVEKTRMLPYVSILTNCLQCLTRFVSLAIYYYRWSEDPFTQGAYSEPVVGFTSDDFNELGQNLGRLYFAGEGTSEDWYGYMQGAYYTGEEKGKLIACQILPSDSECKAPEKKKSEATFAARSAAGVLVFSLLCSRLWI